MHTNASIFTRESSPFFQRLLLWPFLSALVVVGLIVWAGGGLGGAQGSYQTAEILVLDIDGDEVGRIEMFPLGTDGSLKLSFLRGENLAEERNFEWWQLAEREDRSGYPRIDPQSGGSGLPGAKGEDEDPAYYSESDFTNPELSQLILADGKFWLLDRPTHDSGFRFESWLVERTGRKGIVLLAGISWGVSVRNGEIAELHHPEVMQTTSRFDWEESLRISGFGSGWQIHISSQRLLP